MTMNDLDTITLRMEKEISAAGGKLSKVYYCIQTKSENCNCRKPRNGLFVKAQSELSIADMEKSFFVGDTDWVLSWELKEVKRIAERLGLPSWRSELQGIFRQSVFMGGNELRIGYSYLEVVPLFSIAPGLMITLAVLAFNFMGDGLRDALDPRLRGTI